VRLEKVKNKLKKFLQDKRAITPVLSSLLLTVVAVAGMAIATSATYVITGNLRETMGERLVAEDVWFNPATRTVDVYLRNVGKVNIHISNVYVNHTSQPFNSPFSLELNQHGWLSIVCDWNSGDLYYVDVVTKRGTHVASYYRAP
jgi:FlaG/FlaF family flagellin (archaellin)